ncbi:MAG: glycerophosphodiester phosphodiesterase [Clostridia bacterium]|nr:glycerophosphodiester phosphodiesterase [Clostridia bacterium]
MLNIAHRGFSGKYPENTMLAFRKAVEIGADGIELDVQYTKDRQLVIIHDESVDRTCDGKGLVADMTLEELRKLDASAGFRGIYGINRIPTLREYFELVAPLKGFVTNIELKTGINEYDGIEQMVCDMIKEFGLEDRIIISSFNHFSVARFKALCPEMKCGFLEGDWIIDFGAYAKKNGADFVHPRYNTVTDETAAEILSNGIGINTWTVNTEDEVRRLYKLGVNSVIGNYPDMAKEVIETL